MAYPSCSVSFLSYGENENLFSLRQKALGAHQVLRDMIERSLMEVSSSCSKVNSHFLGVFRYLCSSQHTLIGLWRRMMNVIKSPSTKPYFSFIRHVASTDRSADQMIHDIIAIAVCSSIMQAQGA